MELDFVNLHGQPVSVSETAPQKRQQKRQREASHHGFFAMGIPPEDLAAAKLQPGFDLALFVRNAKRKKVTARAYSSAATANEACRIAEKSGWVGCFAIEKKAE